MCHCLYLTTDVLACLGWDFNPSFARDENVAEVVLDVVEAIEFDSQKVIFAYLIVGRRNQLRLRERQLNLEGVLSDFHTAPAERIVPRILRICHESINREAQKVLTLSIDQDIIR